MRHARLLSLLLLAACGKIPDAPADGSDAAPEIPDARLPGVARITLRSRVGAPVSGATVVFTRPDGATLPAGDATTDSSGVAQAVINPGDWIWVQHTQDDGSIQTFTVVEAQPGDDIVLDERTSVPTTQRPMTVVLPPTGQPQGTTMELGWGCGKQDVPVGTTAVSIMVGDECKDGQDQFTVVLTAKNVDGVVVGYASVRSPYQNSVVLSDWMSNLERLTVQYQNPVKTDGGQGLPLTQVMWNQFSPPGTRDTLQDEIELSPGPTDGISFDTLRFVPVLPLNQVGVIAGLAAGSLSGRFFQPESFGGVLTIDGEGFLPFITNFTYGASTHKFNWSETASDRSKLEEGDIVMLFVSSGANMPHRWTIMGPSTIAPGFTPAIPQAMSAGLPSGDQLGSPNIMVLDYQNAAGWDDLRTAVLPLTLEGMLMPPEQASVRITIGGEIH